jgi:serine/threonine protein kinase/Flp pilus assembly protein TadD
MIGRTISHYKIIEKLGGGGMGVVYKAEDTLLKRTVALKFLPASASLDDEARARFIREAQAASALEHVNICTVHEIGECDGQVFIVMGYYEGETLKSRIESGKLRIEDAIDIATQVARGLARAHEAGITHRDIKPANIMVTNRGEVKILDFGLAKLTGQTILTKTGSTLGTAAYMSPEQASGEQVDQRTDIWSLGVVLYEMLTGRRPFESDQELALLYSVMNEEARPTRSLRPEVPEALEQVVQRTMAKKSADRYQKMEELLADLKVLKEGKTAEHETLASQIARRRRNRRVASVVGLVGVVAVAAFFLLPLLQENALASNPKTIAVISFNNQTGDTSQDNIRNVLQDAIITSLEQSKYLRVTTRERISDILRQLGKKDVEYVDNELGLEICRREGAQLMAVGTFARVGDLYQTTLKLVDVNTLETAGSYSTKGTGVESLLDKQIDDLTREVASGIGVSERKVKEQIRPVAEIGTTSIEAYQLFLRGVQENDKMLGARNLRYFEMAVQKDSQFVAAWCALKESYAGFDTVAEARAARKAVSLADKASEKDKYYIAIFDTTVRAALLGTHGIREADFVKLAAQRWPNDKRFLQGWGFWALREGKVEEAIAAQTRALELDPNYGMALNQLGYIYLGMGDTTKETEMWRRYIAASPGDPDPYDCMGDSYLNRGREDDAIAYFKQATALKAGCWSTAKIAAIYFVREDYGQALQWLDSAYVMSSEPETKAWYADRKAFFALWLGRLNEAERCMEKSASLTKTTGFITTNRSSFLKQWIAYERGRFAECRKHLDIWIPSHKKQNPPEDSLIPDLIAQLCLGLIDVKAERFDSTAIRLAAMDSIKVRISPNDSTARAKIALFIYDRFTRLLRGEGLLAARRSQEALDLALQSVDRLERASRPIRVWDLLIDDLHYKRYFPVMVDIIPRAYQALGQVDSAIVAYERAVEHHLKDRSLPFQARVTPVLPRYHYRLALLYEKKGMKQKAIEQYEQFLKIWGKADPIYKEPADARARLAKLKRG